MKRIAHIGGQIPPNTDQIWGGTFATNNAYIKAFANDTEWYLDILSLKQIRLLEEKQIAAQEIKKFCKDADIIHIDNVTACGIAYQAGLNPPDIIGPIARSPLKKYGDWVCPYPEDWFYQAKVIRLNYQEERYREHLATIITHGIDTQLLLPDFDTPKTDILWAGQTGRHAKNYDLWLDIQSVPAPSGYNYKTMSKYAVQDYWQALSQAAVVVCTSLYESFCNAAFEALSCGVPVVWKNKLQGKGFWEDAGIRCEYTAESFRDAINKAIKFDNTTRASMRQYVIDNCSLKHMRNSYVKIFNEVLNEKNKP